MKKILSNKIRCNKCGEVIESKSLHDMVWCKCGECAADGGHYYLRRCYKSKTPEESYTELSVTEGEYDDA